MLAAEGENSTAVVTQLADLCSPAAGACKETV